MKVLALICLVTICNAKTLVEVAKDLGATTLVDFVITAGLEGALNGQG